MSSQILAVCSGLLFVLLVWGGSGKSRWASWTEFQIALRGKRQEPENSPTPLQKTNWLAAGFCTQVYCLPPRYRAWRWWILVWILLLWMVAGSVLVIVGSGMLGRPVIALADIWPYLWNALIAALLVLVVTQSVIVWDAHRKLGRGWTAWSRARSVLKEYEQRYPAEIKALDAEVVESLPWWWPLGTSGNHFLAFLTSVGIKMVLPCVLLLLGLFLFVRGAVITEGGGMAAGVWCVLVLCVLAMVTFLVRMQFRDFYGAAWRNYSTFAYKVLAKARRDGSG